MRPQKTTGRHGGRGTVGMVQGGDIHRNSGSQRQVKATEEAPTATGKTGPPEVALISDHESLA